MFAMDPGPVEAPPDPVLPGATGLKLARRQGIAAARLSAVDESGRKGRAYVLDERVILKTHRPNRLRGRLVEEFETSVEKEAFFLRKLSQHPEIRTPHFLGYGRADGVEYVCMSRLVGITLRHSSVASAQHHAVLRQLGQLLARIHQLPVAPFVASGLFPHDGGPAELR